MKYSVSLQYVNISIKREIVFYLVLHSLYIADKCLTPWTILYQYPDSKKS